MKCFGGMVEYVALDPNPKAQDNLQVEYNCANCGSYQYCVRLANLLEKYKVDVPEGTSGGV